MGTLIVTLLIVAILYFAGTAYFRKKKREALTAKYGDSDVVERIMKRTIWQGMSEAQLIDSWGSPAAKDQKLYKTKSRFTFKYNRTGKNRFSNRVFVENGIVVGWETK